MKELWIPSQKLIVKLQDDKLSVLRSDHSRAGEPCIKTNIKPWTESRPAPEWHNKALQDATENARCSRVEPDTVQTNLPASLVVELVNYRNNLDVLNEQLDRATKVMKELKVFQ
jgi:hypothetical protein